MSIDTRDRRKKTLALIAHFCTLSVIGVAVTIAEPKGWAIWFLIAPLMALVLVSIYGVWFW